MKQIYKLMTIVALILCITSCNLKINNGTDITNDSSIASDNTVSSDTKDDTVIKTYTYEESMERIVNPEQGFYSPIYAKLNALGGEFDPWIVDDNTSLYHLRIDISAFSYRFNNVSDLEITKSALNYLDEMLNYFYVRDKSVIVRFAYDPGFNGKSNMEPSENMIIKHIESLGTVLNKYSTAITAIEAGLLGPWGEMHTSSIITDSLINRIIKAFLDNTNSYILVRTPKMLYSYLGITMNDGAEYIVDNDYRLGLFNDGYLGSASDLGTYQNKELEMSFVSSITSNTPFGGEVVLGNDANYRKADYALKDLKRHHASYFNLYWNDNVITEWKNTIYESYTLFNEIENHLGYRFVIKSSCLVKSKSKIEATINLSNVGYGKLNKKAYVRMIAVDNDGNIYTKLSDVRFDNEKIISISIDNLDYSKEYDISISLSLEGDKYFIELANKNVFNQTNRSNYIGKI